MTEIYCSLSEDLPLSFQVAKETTSKDEIRMHAQLLEQLSLKQIVSQTDNFRETGINNAQTHDFQGLSQSDFIGLPRFSTR